MKTEHLGGMHLYVELWKPKDTWRSLGRAERDSVLAGLGPLAGALEKRGVELLGFALNDEDTAHRADYLYLGLWRMPTNALARELEEGVIASGFHEYFEQINAGGTLLEPEAALEHMASLPGVES